MTYGFKRSHRNDAHYDLAREAGRQLKNGNLLKRSRNEREFEQAIVATLESSPELAKNLITQVGEREVDKVTQAHLFGFKHRPDIAIGNDGTAIEIKAVTRGYAVRDLIGQAFMYRVHYRFVLLVLVDQTPDRQIVQCCSDPESPEHRLLQDLSENLCIFSIVGPQDHGKNIVFLPKAEEPTSEAA